MLDVYYFIYWEIARVVHLHGRDTYQWVAGVTRRVRDEHDAIVSLPSWDWKALAVRALAATILSSNLDFLRHGEFILSVLHCEVFQKQWAFAYIPRCAIGKSGRKRCRRSGVPEDVGRRIKAKEWTRNGRLWNQESVEDKEEEGARCWKRCM
jgi:hypothetical protein